MIRALLVALVAGLFLAANGVAQADVLLIDRMARASHIAVPKNGDTMAQVESRFGEPEERMAAVGDPPITRWRYRDFIVYFEYERVLSSVVNRSVDQEQGPRGQ